MQMGAIRTGNLNHLRAVRRKALAAAAARLKAKGPSSSVTVSERDAHAPSIS
jgi:hypothetical protein